MPNNTRDLLGRVRLSSLSCSPAGVRHRPRPRHLVVTSCCGINCHESRMLIPIACLGRKQLDVTSHSKQWRLVDVHASHSVPKRSWEKDKEKKKERKELRHFKRFRADDVCSWIINAEINCCYVYSCPTSSTLSERSISSKMV